MKIGGPKAAGLGTDFDGIEDPPAGLEDVSKLPKLTEELLRRGHSEEEVRGRARRELPRASGTGPRRPGRPCRPRTEPLPFSKPETSSASLP